MGTAVDMGAYEAMIGLTGSLSLNPDPVGAGQAVMASVRVTNTGVITLHATLTATLSPHLIPNAPFTWTAVITPNTTWTQVFTATIEPGYRGSVTSTIEATTLEGPAGVFTATTTALIPISGLAAVNDSPTDLGSPTVFTATIATGDAVSYTWSFGDLTSGTGAVVTHIYSTPGIYTASVTASNAVGVFTATTSVTITDTTIAGLKASNDSPTVLGLPTTLTATIQAGTGVTYRWNFGDGTLGIGSTVTHTYPACGVYTAVVTATTATSAVTATTFVTITDALMTGLIAFNSSPTVLGHPTTFTATLAARDNVTFTWSFGDTTFGTGSVVTHTYPYTGSYMAVVTTTCSASVLTATTIVNIIANPLSPRIYLPIVLRVQP
jgi:PKD repeat protein